MDRCGKVCRRYLWTLLMFLALCVWTCGGFRAQAASSWSYGSQLTGTAREVYAALEREPDLLDYYDSGSRSGGGKGLRIEISGNYKISSASSVVRECYRGCDAFLKDHSEVFWVSQFRLSCQIDMLKNRIESVEAFPVDYYDGIRSEITSARQAISQASAYVRKFKGRFAKVKAAHDYIADLVDYNTGPTDHSYYHTVTGGLLKKYDNTGVCETYAKLFDIVCKANGIPSFLAIGGAKSGSAVQVNHMWNYVQMNDGKWYLVDITYDDQKGGILYDYFLAGTESRGFAGKAGTDHHAVGVLSGYQYEPFRFPSVSKSAYKKAEKLTVRQEKIALALGRSYRIIVGVASGGSVTYASSNKKIVSVDANGSITAKKKGTATITVKAPDGRKMKIKVTVR